VLFNFRIILLTHCAHTHLLYIRSQFQFFTCQYDEECPSQTDQLGHGSHPCLTGRKGIGMEG